MNKPWDMARVASRREQPKQRKMLGPVGEWKPGNEGSERCYSRGIAQRDSPSVYFAPGECSTCKHCGYHVCDCHKAREKALVDEIRQLQKALLDGPWFFA